MKRCVLIALQIAVGLLFLLLLATATGFGMLMNFLFVFMLASLCVKSVSRCVSAFKKKVYWDLWRKPFDPASRPYLLQAAFRILFWLVLAACVRVAVVPSQFSAGEWKSIVWTLWVVTGVLCIIEFIPRIKIGATTNTIYGLTVVYCAFELCRVYMSYGGADAVVAAPPFQGQWYVFNGGNSPLNNPHHFYASQRWAFDLMVPEDVPASTEPNESLESYRSFGQPILSPVEGVIAAVETEADDQPIGSMDVQHLAGNYVVIRCESGQYILLAHLQKGSVEVEVNDVVHPGQRLGACGNSGNTSQPHLHIQAMTEADLFSPYNKPVPLLFSEPDGGNPRPYKRNDIILGREANIAASGV